MGRHGLFGRVLPYFVSGVNAPMSAGPAYYNVVGYTLMKIRVSRWIPMCFSLETRLLFSLMLFDGHLYHYGVLFPSTARASDWPPVVSGGFIAIINSKLGKFVNQPRYSHHIGEL